MHTRMRSALQTAGRLEASPRLPNQSNVALGRQPAEGRLRAVHIHKYTNSVLKYVTKHS